MLSFFYNFNSLDILSIIYHQRFNEEIAKMSDEFHALKREGERWGSKSLPVKWMEEFRELSPGTKSY